MILDLYDGCNLVKSTVLKGMHFQGNCDQLVLLSSKHDILYYFMIDGVKLSHTEAESLREKRSLLTVVTTMSLEVWLSRKSALSCKSALK